MDWLDSLLGNTRARIVRLLRRSRRTVADLAESVGISGNAVRGHVVALKAEGMVQDAGMAPSTGGKPAHLYDLTPEAEELFPKAYASMLAELIGALEERDGHERTLELLRSVGGRAARGVEAGGGPPETRVQAAAEVLRSIGGDVVVLETEDGWEIRGFGCPLSGVVVREPDTCQLAEGLVAQVTELPVTECCDRSGGRARCAFRVHESAS